MVLVPLVCSVDKYKGVIERVRITITALSPLSHTHTCLATDLASTETLGRISSSTRSSAGGKEVEDKDGRDSRSR